MLSEWVDFEYAVDGKTYTYSIPGESSITLSDLLLALNVTGSDKETATADVKTFVSNVENVEFSDPELVEVKKDGDDWTLTSLKPFTSEEKLTITMKNGEKVEVKVTDAQNQINWYLYDAGNYFSNPQYATIKLKYVDKNGKDISSFITGSSVNDTVYSNNTIELEKYKKSISGYHFIKATDSKNNDVIALITQDTGEDYNLYFYNSQSQNPYRTDSVDNYYSTTISMVYEEDNPQPGGGDEPSGGDTDPAVQNIKGATVHYGYMEGNTFHEFTHAQFTPPTSGFGDPAYLIYDVPGYQYAGTTTHVYTSWGRKVTENVAPIIEGSSSGDYYVTYEPRPAAQPGGNSANANNYPEEPSVVKKSEENPDTGTNTISLEVEGKRKTASPKADIIVIYDVSTSMKFPIGFNSSIDIEAPKTGYDYMISEGDELPPWGGQRNYLVKKGLKDLANDLMGNNTPGNEVVRMALVPFSTTFDEAQFLGFTGSASEFNRKMYSLELNGGTNWEDALQKANSMKVREDADAYIIFVTDGNPTFRITRFNEKESDLTGSGNLSGISHNDGNNFYDKYGIFGTGNTDKDRTTPRSSYLNYQAALTIANSIKAENKTLFGIGVSPEASQLETLIKETYKSKDNYYSVEKEGQVKTAIDAIKGTIKEKTFGYSDVKITDGITALTQTVQKTGMMEVLPDSDDFEYFKNTRKATQADVAAGKAKKVGEPVWEPWTEAQMAAEGAGRASYNEQTGAVEWNLGEEFMLKDGESYKVDFTVWPSQEAYDLLADLNNGKEKITNLNDSVKGQMLVDAGGTRYEFVEGKGWTKYPYEPENSATAFIDDQALQDLIDSSTASFALKTNTSDAGYTYKKATKEGEDGPVITNGEAIPGIFNPVIPPNLRTDKISVQKRFNNLLDSRDPTQISLELWGNRLFKTFTLTKDGQWKSDDNYISCGLLTVNKDTGELYVYENGHDFTLKETGADSIYWELTADTYHPMVINDELHMLSKVDAPDGMGDAKYFEDTDGKEYYRIKDKATGLETVYVDEGTDAILKAVNDHRSFLDLSKSVIDASGNTVPCDEMFSFNAIFNERRTNDDIIFTVYDTVNKKYISDDSITNAALTPADDQANKTPYYKIANQTEITLKIKQGWNVRFLNLSNDKTYNIEEVLGADSEYVLAKVEGFATQKVNGNTVSVDTHMKINSGQAAMSGTIAEANTLYAVKYSNKKAVGSIELTKKVTVDGIATTTTKADGDYYFTIMDKDGKPATGKIEGTSITDGTVKLTVKNGKASSVIITDVPVGTYTITELAPNNGTDATNLEGTNLDVVSTSTGNITIKNNETSKATFTNDRSSTTIDAYTDRTVKKVWLDKDGNPLDTKDTANKSIKYRLTQERAVVKGEGAIYPVVVRILDESGKLIKSRTYYCKYTATPTVKVTKDSNKSGSINYKQEATGYKTQTGTVSPDLNSPNTYNFVASGIMADTVITVRPSVTGLNLKDITLATKYVATNPADYIKELDKTNLK